MKQQRHREGLERIHWREPAECGSPRISFTDYVSQVLPLGFRTTMRVALAVTVGIVVLMAALTWLFRLWPIHVGLTLLGYVLGCWGLLILLCGVLAAIGYAIYIMTPVYISVNEIGLFIGAVAMPYTRIRELRIDCREPKSARLSVNGPGRDLSAAIDPRIDVGQLRSILSHGLSEEVIEPGLHVFKGQGEQAAS